MEPLPTYILLIYTELFERTILPSFYLIPQNVLVQKDYELLEAVNYTFADLNYKNINELHYRLANDWLEYKKSHPLNETFPPMAIKDVIITEVYHCVVYI